MMCSANQDTKYNQHDCSYSLSFFCLFPLQPQPWDQNVNTCHVYYTLIKLFQQSSPFPPPLSLDNPRAFDGCLWLGKGGGEFNPCLARVRKLSWKCQVFPTENTCFIFSYWGVYKVMGSLFQGNGSEKNVKEVKVFMLGQWVNLWCFFLPSNPALEEGIWTQFWPQGMGQSILQKFKCSEGSPGGEMLKLWINWLTTHSISSYSFKC